MSHGGLASMGSRGITANDGVYASGVGTGRADARPVQVPQAVANLARVAMLHGSTGMTSNPTRSHRASATKSDAHRISDSHENAQAPRRTRTRGCTTVGAGYGEGCHRQ